MRQIMREDVDIEHIGNQSRTINIVPVHPSVRLRIDDRLRTTYKLVQQSGHRT